MKDFEKAMAKLLAEKERAQTIRAIDIGNVNECLRILGSLSKDAEKELSPAIKRLTMFVNGEKYTRTK